MGITALIADDESVLRAHLKRLLAIQWPALQIIGEAEDGEQAIQIAEQQRPDIAFLDIRMPGISGMKVAAEINSFCRIVFVTAYDEYALDAFEKQAVDYLLKPVTAERLACTVDRLQSKLNDKRKLSSQVVKELLSRLSLATSPSQYLQWIKTSKVDGVRLISVNEVCYFQAAEKYTKVVTPEGEELIRTSITKLAESLDPEQFWRIHRATIVNVSVIREASRSFTGRYRVHLKNHEDILTVSRTYGRLFKQM